jgi:hypothetical protein
MNTDEEAVQNNPSSKNNVEDSKNMRKMEKSRSASRAQGIPEGEPRDTPTSRDHFGLNRSDPKLIQNEHIDVSRGFQHEIFK